MKFANPEFLYFLVFIPVMAWYLIRLRHQAIPTFRFSSLSVIPQENRNSGLGLALNVVGLLRIVAVFFLILALARPQKGLKSSEMMTKTTDIIVCLDVSRSMLSVDFKPKNRFQVAKNVIAEFVKGREFDRIGFVIFAEDAVTQCPLTLDRTALLVLLESLEIGVIPADQTAVGLGLANSVNRLKKSEAKSKVIILVTDGANNVETIDPITAAKTAQAYGIRVYTIGAGSPDGGLMPVQDPFLGERLVPFKSDLDEDKLLQIASLSGGKYFRATSSDALKKIFSDIDSLEKTDIKVKEYVDYQELYIWFVAIALALVFIELLLTKTWAWSLP